MASSTFRHDNSLTWHTRDAPLHNGGSALKWRERAALHRAKIGLQKPAEARVNAAERESGHCQDEHARMPSTVDTAAEAFLPTSEDAALLAADISAADLVVTDTLTGDDHLISVADDESDTDEGYNDDWWGLCMRIDIEHFIAYKNVQMRLAAQSEEKLREAAAPSGGMMKELAAAPTFENSAVFDVISEIVAWERTVLRRQSRRLSWPDMMLAPAVMSRDQVDELKCNVVRWTSALEALDSIDRQHATLQLLPVDFVLHQLLADALTAAGETQEARWALLLVVGASSPEKQAEVRVGEAQFAPPRIGWDDRCDCNLVKAQQCVRFGRLAVISAEALVSSPMVEEYTHELCKLRSAQRENALRQEIASGLRHLNDARKLYRSELSTLEQVFQCQAGWSGGSLLWGEREVNSLRLALRCGYLGATGLLAAIYILGGRIAEARSAFDEALREAGALLGDPSCTPRLQRLLAAEREKMLTERAKLQ